jgi:hypothetical protein
MTRSIIEMRAESVPIVALIRLHSGGDYQPIIWVRITYAMPVVSIVSLMAKTDLSIAALLLTKKLVVIEI